MISEITLGQTNAIMRTQTILQTNNLRQINKNEILNMSKFIVEENFKHHTSNEFPSNIQEEINSIYKEEMDYVENSKIYSVENDFGKIIGIIRVLKWDFINPLPIEKLFGINPLLCTENKDVNEFWHIGRFAIDKTVCNLTLLKRLMVWAIAPICKNKNNIAFAECDAKLLRVLSLMGIKTKIIGDSIDYLGSETIPISMSYNGLIEFYNNNKHLIFNDVINKVTKASELYNKVVFV